MTTVLINGRFLTQAMTGVQRYGLEITRALLRSAVDSELEFEVICPHGIPNDLPMEFFGRVREIGRFQGHAWEQLELGPYVWWRDLPMWSPMMSNPLLINQQVVTIHDLFALEHPEWVGKGFHRWYQFLLPRLASRAKQVVTVSEYSRQRLMHVLGVNAERISIAPPGVDQRFVRPDISELQRVQMCYELPTQFVLALGSLEPRKNLNRIVRAWQRLGRTDELPLVIAGGLGSTKVFGDFDPTALEGQGVRLLGYVPDEDLPALYASASVFVYVSLLEGFGMPPLEAFLCGTPVVVSNNSGMLEVMGEVATLVNPTDEQDICDGLARALGPLPDFIDLKDARQRLRRRFEWSRSAKTVFEVLQVLVDGAECKRGV